MNALTFYTRGIEMECKEALSVVQRVFLSVHKSVDKHPFLHDLPFTGRQVELCAAFEQGCSGAQDGRILEGFQPIATRLEAIVIIRRLGFWAYF